MTAHADTAARDDTLELRGAARTEGAGAAVTRLCALLGDGVVPFGPRGHALVPATLAETADSVWRNGAPGPRDRTRETALRTVRMPGGEALVALRRTDPFPHAPDEAAAAPGWVRALTALRLGLSERLLDASIDYLGGRRAGDTALLQLQLVKVGVADAVIGHLEVDSVLAGAADGADVEHLNDRLTRTDRTLLRLLGASSFLSSGPGQVAWASELLADAYVESGRGEDAS